MYDFIMKVQKIIKLGCSIIIDSHIVFHFDYFFGK